MDFMENSRFCALWLLITVFYVLHIHCARGSSSIENSLEPNQELNNIVKTIKTEYGDIYDCMGLYKQPAFDHPLLKHHKIQMKPSFAPENKEWEKNSSSSFSSFGLKEPCPLGTVPIRRVTQEEKQQAKAVFLQHSQLYSSSSPQNDGIMAFAGVTSDFPLEIKVYGGGGLVSTHNPTVDMQQASASVISMEYGQDDQFATIRIGWVVNPHLYGGDNHTRLYSLWSQHSDGGGVQGCFNTYCPGFIQTSPKIPLDMVLDPVSAPQGQQQYIAQELELDGKRGNWWYHFGENKEQVGYWPSDLFTNLKYGAQRARWGGMAVSYNSQNFPDMGSGQTDDTNGCHFKEITGLLNKKSDTNTTLLKWKNNNWHIPITISETKCYKVGGVSEMQNLPWGVNFWFGGKGGSVDQCKD